MKKKTKGKEKEKRKIEKREKKKKCIFWYLLLSKSKDYIKRETEFNLNSIYVEKLKQKKRETERKL